MAPVTSFSDTENFSRLANRSPASQVKLLELRSRCFSLGQPSNTAPTPPVNLLSEMLKVTRLPQSRAKSGWISQMNQLRVTSTASSRFSPYNLSSPGMMSWERLSWVSLSMPSGCCNAGGGQGEHPRQADAPPRPTDDGVEVAELVTQDFFDGIANHADGDFPGKRFYTRAAFLEALASFPGFGGAATPDDSKREVAAFFAHVTHETGHFRFIEEICDDGRGYRDESRVEYPCAPGKRYHGRGPLQITWNYNYGAAGASLGFDGLGSPETVAEDPVVSFKTALWYWMERVRPAMASGGSFGATIRAINGGECSGGNPKAVARRVRFYKQYCERFGVAPGDDLTC